MKSNFDFLNRYWPALAQIGATAETYVYSDPNACIYKLGMFAERLVQEILVFEHIAEPAVDNTHANRIRILKRAGLLPHEIDNTLYVLRKTRNTAVHTGTDSVDEAKTLLSLTYNLAVWFMETYGDWGYIAPEFVMPSETTHEDLESVIAEQERKIEELTKQLAVVKTAASGKTQKERARRSESVSAMMNWNEAQTRCLIDEQLRLSGWEADTQNLRYSKGTRPVKGRNIAISEWPTNSAFYKNGYADYAFFVGEKLVALMDAKKMSEDVASTIDVQVKDYDCLDDWEKRQGYEIISDGNAACIAAYEASTLFILNKLLELSQIHNKGQKEVNERYLRNCDIAFSDPKKEEALKYAFVNSRVLLVYGAAGTGKTTLIDMISTMLSGRRKLFLTKTHTALQNLQRRINNPGADASFVSINSFTKRVNLPDYDVIFVDECSTIDNRAMKVFLEKMRPDTFLVLAGDTYQIESIDFGNWFTYAKDIIKTKGSNVELVSTWRTKDPGLIELWNETRNKGALITEKLVIDGPFSENIGAGVLNSEIMDEVILCLNYDGKFGLNNMNSYFQNANTETAVVWRDWKYKVGDHILFNDTDRFSLLYNNLKGQIVQIELFDSRIRFTVDVEIPLTEQDCQNDGIEFIDIIDDVTRIRFDVLDFEEEMADEDRKKAIVPFQLAYAVSIHKAQGLEYRSVKVVIPSSNAEKITHGIFYTAITRAKEKLKIYWSSETMQEVVAGFSVDTSRQKSLAIIKEKLKQDKNT